MINTNGDFVIHTTTDGSQCYIPAQQVAVIKANFQRGVGYPQVSPVYAITRQQLAQIVNS